MFLSSTHIQLPSVRFRRWSREGYAVFRSLAANVTIGRVCKSICEMAFRKGNGVGARQASYALYADRQAEREGKTDVLQQAGQPVEQLLAVMAATASAAAAHACALYDTEILTRGGWNGRGVCFNRLSFYSIREKYEKNVFQCGGGRGAVVGVRACATAGRT